MDQRGEEGVEGFGAVDLDCWVAVLVWECLLVAPYLGCPTHSYACSRYRDLEELILLLGCAGVAGS